MEKEIQTLDQTLEELLSKTAVVKKDKARLAKALTVLSGKAPKDQQGRIAPSLEHVVQAAQIVLHKVPEISAEMLTQKITEILHSQPKLNRQGLALRIKQYIASCPRSESSGLIVAHGAKTTLDAS